MIRLYFDLDYVLLYIKIYETQYILIISDLSGVVFITWGIQFVSS